MGSVHRLTLTNSTYHPCEIPFPYGNEKVMPLPVVFQNMILFHSDVQSGNKPNICFKNSEFNLIFEKDYNSEKIILFSGIV